MRSSRISILAFACAFLISTRLTSSTDLDGQLQPRLPSSEKLYDTIAQMDSVVFEAFNHRNLSKLRTMFSEDLEFYHDLGGVTRYAENMEAFGKAFAGERLVRRELVAGSLEVYPIKDYGAVEMGVHRFYATEKGQQEKLSSEARFIHVWHRIDNEWTITRIISYAHQE